MSSGGMPADPPPPYLQIRPLQTVEQAALAVMSSHSALTSQLRTYKTPSDRYEERAEIKWSRLRCSEGKQSQRDFYDYSPLKKHLNHFHNAIRTVWICRDLSDDKTFLADCRFCCKSKQYSAKQYAIMHLRKKHFSMKKPLDDVQTWLEEKQVLDLNNRSLLSHTLEVQGSESMHEKYPISNLVHPLSSDRSLEGPLSPSRSLSPGVFIRDLDSIAKSSPTIHRLEGLSKGFDSSYPRDSSRRPYNDVEDWYGDRQASCSSAQVLALHRSRVKESTSSDSRQWRHGDKKQLGLQEESRASEVSVDQGSYKGLDDIHVNSQTLDPSPPVGLRKRNPSHQSPMIGGKAELPGSALIDPAILLSGKTLKDEGNRSRSASPRPSMMRRLSYYLAGIFSVLYYEPPLQTGKTRLRWKCVSFEPHHQTHSD